MPQISQKKKEKISEQILHYLFSISPRAEFTAKVAAEIARDEEFTKALLLELKSKNLVVEVNKNALGKPYIRRQRWRLSNEVFNVYNKQQNNNF